ncbi:hypothetical protein ASG22_17620 [Chryseobacterium sp. Leaf405]|uniref:hypothetical protein n=1 Tax=Chryseobacterium sp. Leaf405 TaxID=1736367 RepID=UPI0006FEFBAC|nr:hypothetical protein [Chryseobacterium sp. Leaf405]KQT33917.1 hypothetical protein ASG22_17620 [Chryseobacterium sp. Leaf405]
MSRTRIVQGKYIKISQGEHNMSAEGNIVSNALLEVREKGNDNGVIHGNFERKGSDVNEDFEITFSLRKDKEYSTVVPFGILDFKGKYENPHFVFDYSLTLSNVDSLEFKILTEDSTVLYAAMNLPELVIPSKKIPLLAESIVKGTPIPDPLQPKKVPDLDRIFNPYNIPPTDYTKIGSYMIFWDGFDENDIYDSAKFDNKRFKAQIIAKKNGKEKIKEVEFSTKYSEVDWVDVKIDKKSKRIDTTLRVNLKDGGEEGLQCTTHLVGGRDETKWETKCPWDKISKEALAYYNMPPITKRKRTYKELEDLTLLGINQFWSRNSKNIGKAINILSDMYEVYVDAKVNNEGLAAPKIIYQTNCEEGRSRNFEASRILFFYEGYLYNADWKRSDPKSNFYHLKGWYYRSENKVEKKNVLSNLSPLLEDYKMVSAHEIGHEILLTYGGSIYSKSHKSTTTGLNLISQNTDEDAPDIPETGEIDLMKYYQRYYDIPRTIISELDLLKVIWLTKIEIK